MARPIPRQTRRISVIATLADAHVPPAAVVRTAAALSENGDQDEIRAAPPTLWRFAGSRQDVSRRGRTPPWKSTLAL
jgi:hypothetical protein